MIHTILKMGDPRLLRVAPPVERFDTPELHALIEDMFETMAAAQGVGLAAPQIGVDLQLVIFGFCLLYTSAGPAHRGSAARGAGKVAERDRRMDGDAFSQGGLRRD